MKASNITGNKVTSKMIIDAFVSDIFRTKSGNRIFPNTYIGKWEADILEVTSSKYQYEYEVKISRSDFKNDSKKSMKRYKLNENSSHGYTTESLLKHEFLQQGKRTNYFYFIVPDGLIEESEVPEWAGLIYFKRYVIYDIFNNPARIETSFKTIKPAKKLHGNKITDKQFLKLYESTYFRYHNIKKKIHD